MRDRGRPFEVVVRIEGRYHCKKNPDPGNSGFDEKNHNIHIVHDIEHQDSNFLDGRNTDDIHLMDHKFAQFDAAYLNKCSVHIRVAESYD